MPPVPYNKPWTSIDAQIKKLVARGMSIDNKKMASRWLKKVGYYRLVGYWHELRELDTSTPNAPRKDSFTPGSNFNDVVKLYLFDEKLRLLMLQAISSLEIALRAQIMYELSKKHPQAYLDTKFFNNNFTSKQPGQKSKHDFWLEKIHSSVERSKSEPFLQHFLNKYCQPNDPNWWETLPFWMLVDCWDFGVLSKCCSGLKTAWCSKVAQHFGSLPGPVFASWVYMLNIARNFSAHHRRIWNRRWIVSSPMIKMLSSSAITGIPAQYFAHITANYIINNKIQKSTYMVLAIIKYFLIWTVKDQGRSWGLEIRALMSSFPTAFGDPSKLGFPQNWEAENLWSL